MNAAVWFASLISCVFWCVCFFFWAFAFVSLIVFMAMNFRETCQLMCADELKRRSAVRFYLSLFIYNEKKIFTCFFTGLCFLPCFRGQFLIKTVISSQRQDGPGSERSNLSVGRSWLPPHSLRGPAVESVPVFFPPRN